MFHQGSDLIRELHVHVACKPTFVSIVFIKGNDLNPSCVVTNGLPSGTFNYKGTVGDITLQRKLQPSRNNHLLFPHGT